MASVVNARVWLVKCWRVTETWGTRRKIFKGLDSPLNWGPEIVLSCMQWSGKAKEEYNFFYYCLLMWLICVWHNSKTRSHCRTKDVCWYLHVLLIAVPWLLSWTLIHNIRNLFQNDRLHTVTQNLQLIEVNSWVILIFRTIKWYAQGNAYI